MCGFIVCKEELEYNPSVNLCSEMEIVPMMGHGGMGWCSLVKLHVTPCDERFYKFVIYIGCRRELCLNYALLVVPDFI